MSRSHLALLAAALAIISAMVAFAAQTAPPQQTPGAKTQSSAATPASVQEINDGFVEKITKQIAGREQEPAEKVFANIQIFKGVPAARLLLIMNLGYSTPWESPARTAMWNRISRATKRDRNVRPEKCLPCIGRSMSSSRR